MTDCATTAAEKFNGSFLASLFPNVETAAGQNVVAGIAEYVCCAKGGAVVYGNCPAIWDCLSPILIAYILKTWGFVFDEVTEENPDGGWSANPDDELVKWVKRDTVGQVTREYDWKPDKQQCNTCDDSMLAQWKAEIDRLYSTCEAAMQPAPFVTGLTDWGSYSPDECGCCDRRWLWR